MAIATNREMKTKQAEIYYYIFHGMIMSNYKVLALSTTTSKRPRRFVC